MLSLGGQGLAQPPPPSFLSVLVFFPACFQRDGVLASSDGFSGRLATGISALLGRSSLGSKNLPFASLTGAVLVPVWEIWVSDAQSTDRDLLPLRVVAWWFLFHRCRVAERAPICSWSQAEFCWGF